MRVVVAAGLLLALSGTAIPQSTERPKFDAADVHSVPVLSAVRFVRSGVLRGNRYEMRNVTLVDLIASAYGVDFDKVFGGPSWLEMDRFDVIALAPAKTPRETLNLMLQSLLEDRFKLAAQRESRPLPAIAIKQGKHLLIKEADGSGDPGCRTTVQGLNPRGPSDGPVTAPSLTLQFSCHSVSIATAMAQLPTARRPGEITKPFLDQTGLKGVWNMDFKFNIDTPDDLNSLSDMLDKQLGLRLEPTTAPVPVIAVKSVNQKPTPNSSEEMKLFPPLPTEFEVAEIKPYKSDGNEPVAIAKNGMRVVARARGGPQLQNGRVNLTGYTMKQLIMLAWDLNNDNMLVGAPKWMDNDRFTVIAKIPDGPAADAFNDMDSVKPMLRKLLLDRFKMTVHSEERQLPGYVLSAAKPKLKKADPNGRTKWIDGPGADGKDPRNGNEALGRLVSCQNMTMAQFAALLPNIAPGYLRNETVLDQTGLDGAWDFTFYFSGAGIVDGRGARGGDQSSASAQEPSAGITLFDALTKLLGLKLDQQKRPMQALVIDHAEQTPMEN